MPSDTSNVEALHPYIKEARSTSLDDSSKETRARTRNVSQYLLALDVGDSDKLQRRLKQRHIQMIGIAGTLGTGLFLASGSVLATAGPLGALIAYGLVGSVAFSTLCVVSEMAAYAPISGSFPHLAARWVDPALGFAIGWNYFYTAAISVPGEITSATILVTFWDENTSHLPIYMAVIIVAVISINLCGSRWFGEAEFCFAIMKLTMIIGLILAGLIIDLGGGPDHQRRGFQYWKNPGPFAGAGLEPHHPHLDKFLGILSGTIQAAFGFAGMELVAVAASETENPRRNITKAVRKVFWRIFIFYMVGTLIVGMNVSSDNPHLLIPTQTASQSPYVITLTQAGVKVLPSIVNAGIFISAFSAANSVMFAGTRILYGLGLRGLAPKIFAYCTNGGLPIVAVIITSCFPFLAYMAIEDGTGVVFQWFLNLTTIGIFIGWWTINVTFVFFFRACKAQGLDRNDKNYFAYASPFQPYTSYYAIFWTTFFILINGLKVFWNFKASDFIAAYINIPIFVCLYFGYKFWKGTRIWDVAQVDLFTGIPSMEETEKSYVPPTTVWGKVADFLF